jgi:hypothetical protein
MVRLGSPDLPRTEVSAMRDFLRRGAVLLLVAGLLVGLSLSGPAQTTKDAPAKDSKDSKDKKDAPKDKGGKEVPRDKTVNINLEHIFEGGINKNGDLVGMHHYPSAPKELVVDGIKGKVEFFFQNKGGPDEVTTARIEVRDPQTKKVLVQKFSTLYPAGWSKEQVEKAIREAFQDAKDDNGIEADGKWGGVCGAGFRIEGYLSPNKRTITTAFPIYKKK